MTWAEWVNSEYNTGGYILGNQGSLAMAVTDGLYYVYVNGNVIKGVDIIEAGASCTHQTSGFPEIE